MQRAILNKSWRQPPIRHQLYGHLPSITKSIQVRRTRHAGHCWRSRDELKSDVLLWIPTYGRAKAGRLARTYIQQLCEDTGCSPEDLPEKWRERVRDIRAGDTTWWWWSIPISKVFHNFWKRSSSLSDLPCWLYNSFSLFRLLLEKSKTFDISNQISKNQFLDNRTEDLLYKDVLRNKVFLDC